MNLRREAYSSMVVSINETTPAKALIEKGWKSKYLDEYNKKETTISAEKSDMRIDLRVDGTISSTDQLTEKACDSGNICSG